MSEKEVLEQHANAGSKLTVKLLTPQDEFDRAGTVLIEGDAQSLKFLADLLNIYTAQTSQSDLSLHPGGAGRAHFSEDSNLGIYINRRS